MCHSSDYWYNEETDDVFGTKDCALDRGAWMSICAIATYFVSIVMSVGYASRPKRDNFSYEEDSLPSWMASENESSAKAQVPPSTRLPSAEIQEERRASMSTGGYDWSRSGRSMPSAGIKDYGLHDDEEDGNGYPPPAKSAPKKFDDMSTLTWDPGY